ncbi:cell division protein FtsW [bacterium]|nr:cell division protein FtsW [bacterium]
MVYSASITSRPTEFERVYLVRHLAAAGLGIGVAIVASLMNADHWRRWSPGLYGAVLMMLVLVMIPGVGVRVNGAQRWLRIAGVSLQPSELAKIVLPLFTCHLLQTRRDPQLKWWPATVPVLWPTGLMVPLVLLEPDLGTAAFLSVSTLFVLYLGGWPTRRFVACGWLLLPACLGLLFLKPYQWKRITGFMDTWANLDAAPYQIRQSLVALGTGGWWGTGLGKGWQKLSYLPEANTDFVFAVIGEELGLAGTLGIIAVWCGLYLSGMRLISSRPPQSFEFAAGTTLLTQLVLQAAINVAVVTAMVPPKGIAHPLISAGGSNLVASLLTLGIVWSLARTEPEQSAVLQFDQSSLQQAA